MTLNEIFNPSPEGQKVITDKFPGPTITMSFLMEIPVSLATEIYKHGAEKAQLNKTSSLYAVFNAGVHEFIEALDGGEKSDGAKRKRKKSEAERPTES